MSGQFVLVVSYSDHSGVRHAWGPYSSEEDAQAVFDWLREIGVEMIACDILPLRDRMPLRRAEKLDRDISRAQTLAALGIPASEESS